MKQILQNLKNGNIELLDVPSPRLKPGHLLIKTSVSLISAGTERMLLEFGKANWIEKVRQQPDKVRMVLDKIKTDGLVPTLEAINNKLDKPLAMGYCNVGEVLQVGKDVTGFKAGDRVLSNGSHAEVVQVAKNLCVPIPDKVTDEQAVFGVLSAIALQGIRLAKPELGETVAIIGLGVIGLLQVQLLHAQGCRVLGIDFDEQKLALAKQFGAETVDLSKDADPVKTAMHFSRGRGVDAVLIAASSKSNEIMHQAAQMSRKRGRIVLVGVVGLELSRADFYEKELSFQVSCAYGPGRYDKSYEEQGVDYPFSYVRWTLQRNFEAVLDMMADGRIDPMPLISHRFALKKAAEAYQLLGNKASLGIVLQYPTTENKTSTNIRTVKFKNNQAGVDKINVGFVGAGNYATKILIPAFKKAGARLVNIAANSGVSSVYAARKYGFEESTTDVGSVLNNPAINTIAIATRHDSHADLVCNALKQGKKVFVEKPLAINIKQLEQITKVYNEQQDPLLMVGFNRRFAPQIAKIKSLLAGVSEAKTFIMTVNAGFLPSDHWLQNPKLGGGRIIGEACHFIDLLCYLANSDIISFQAINKTAITLNFADGSFGTIHYLVNGHKSFPKERLEIFCAEKILQLDNFKKLRGFGWRNFKTMHLWRQDKGNYSCVKQFVTAKAAPIAIDQLLDISRVTIDIADRLKSL